MDCPVRIRLVKVVTDDAFHYQITKIHLQHENHPVSAEVAALYPENRRVEISDTVKAVCSMSSTRPLEVQQFLQETTNQKIMISDVYNIRSKLKGSLGTDENQLVTLREEISGSGGICKVSVDENEANML